MVSSFAKAYGRLNKEQRRAVDTIYGPVFVIAGPGTGKTSVLTVRIANILRLTDTPASAILALTFTESAVAAMRRKLLELIGPRAYEVRFHTFHGFANDLIKRYPEAFPRIIGAEHMEALEQIRIVERLIASRAGDILRPKNNPHYYVLPVIDAITHIKREGVARASLDKKHPRTKELAALYRAYEKELRDTRLYDFEDMIREAVSVLEHNPDLKLRVQEEHHFVLADEHQDANRSQNRLLELLCDYDDTPNLFIVGDARQAIFRFQGASAENFSYFTARFPTSKLIALRDNYRSQKTILAAAHSLMPEGEALRARHTYRQASVAVVEARTEAEEFAHVAGEIAALLKRGVPHNEIAVLARENVDAGAWETALRSFGIPAARQGDRNIVEQVRIDALRRLFSAVLEPHHDETLAPVLFFDFFRLPLLDVFELVGERGGGSLLRRLARAGGALAAFGKNILRWHTIAQNEPLVAAFGAIAHESGFIREILARHDADEALRLYGTFLDSARRLAERDKRARLPDFLARIERMEAHGVGIASRTDTGQGVQVMTAHKAKGLEFDFVFIVFAREGKWGGKRSRALFSLPFRASDEREAEADERRLFYVALTRARKGAHISWHATDENGRALSPSRFIFEMDEKTREHKQTSLPLARARVLPSRGETYISPFEGGAEGGGCLKNKEYLNGLFLGQGFAVTHLNNFLACPLKYFFLNLLRLPRAQSNAELYGSAVHAALAHYFRAYAREEEKVSASLAIFESALRRTHCAERDFKAFLSQGKRELRGYLGSQTYARACWSEYQIGGVFLDIDEHNIELTGTLDKVELLSEGWVRVVDYKTGAPKAKNPDYFRQLVFYKMLLDGSRKKGWNMKTGVIDFVRPMPSGRYKREEYAITEKETVDLAQCIRAAARDILSLAFLKNGCRKKDCAWCRLYATTLGESR